MFVENVKNCLFLCCEITFIYLKNLFLTLKILHIKLFEQHFVYFSVLHFRSDWIEFSDDETVSIFKRTKVESVPKGNSTILSYSAQQVKVLSRKTKNFSLRPGSCGNGYTT